MKAYNITMTAGAVSIWVLFALHMLAVKNFWYWVFPWFDILMHSLGGVVIGLVVFALLFKWTKLSLIQAVGVTILLALLIGYLWEIHEFIMERYTGANLQPSIADTLEDLFFDMLGAGLASGSASIAIWKTNTQKFYG